MSVMNLLGGEGVAKMSCKPDLITDAAYIVITSDSSKTTGNFFVDDEVLASAGVKDLSKYNVDKKKSI